MSSASLIASPEWPVTDSSLTTLGTLGFQGWGNAIVFPERFLKKYTLIHGAVIQNRVMVLLVQGYQ